MVGKKEEMVGRILFRAFTLVSADFQLETQVVRSLCLNVDQ